MKYKIIQGLFTLSILGIFLLGLILVTNHPGFALTFSQYIFGLIILGVVIYIYDLKR